MHDLACVVHLHSTYSDGTGTVPADRAAGRRAGADVVLLTDHDTLAAKRRGEEGWYGDVLVLVGEEVSPRAGQPLPRLRPRRGDRPSRARRGRHLRRGRGRPAASASPPTRSRSGSERFKRAGTGMPFDALDSEALDGIELWSFVTDTGEAITSVPEMAALHGHAGPRRSTTRPSATCAAWDELCRTRRVVAIGGLDAHQIGKRIGRRRAAAAHGLPPLVPLHPHPRACDGRRPASWSRREAVYEALREGRCYIAVDSIAPARGFSSRPRRRAADGRRGAGGPAHAARAHASAAHGCGCCATASRSPRRAGTAGGTRSSEPGVYRVEACATPTAASAPGSCPTRSTCANRPARTDRA